MSIDFYYVDGSPPCRVVMLTAAALGVRLNMKRLDFMAKDHLKPEFIKINPHHCVPTIDDNGFRLWESRAIIMYLTEKYAKNDTLYPKDLKTRALVNQRLFFDLCSLYQNFNEYYHPILFRKAEANPLLYERILKAMEQLEDILGQSKYLAGDNLTLADLTTVVTISTYEVADFDFGKYPNICGWYSTMKRVAPKYEELNAQQCTALKHMIEKKRSELK